jgi:hypothetical protein
MTTGESSPVIIPGNAADSILVRRILGQDALMPPLNPLSPSEIQIIMDWIAAGAPEN